MEPNENNDQTIWITCIRYVWWYGRIVWSQWMVKHQNTFIFSINDLDYILSKNNNLWSTAFHKVSDDLTGTAEVCRPNGISYWKLFFFISILRNFYVSDTCDIFCLNYASSFPIDGQNFSDYKTSIDFRLGLLNVGSRWNNNLNRFFYLVITIIWLKNSIKRNSSYKVIRKHENIKEHTGVSIE